MRKAYVYKLYQSKHNRKLHRQIDVASHIYNHCITLHKRYYRMFGKHLNVFTLKKHLTKLKRQKRFSHWNELGSQAVQDVAERIENGYKLFFRNLKHGIKTAPPSFRKRVKYKSFTLKQAGWKLLEENKVLIGKRIFRLHKSRDIEGNIKTVTIKRDPLGDVYICFSCEIEEELQERAMTGKMAGFDFGLKTFLTSSDRQGITAPFFFKQSSRELAKANRNLSRKKKGSANRKRARLELARIHKRIANQRKDFHFKLAKELVEKYDYLFLEDLDMKGMQSLWGRKISDLGFASFVNILKHYAEKNGTTVHQIDRFYASSKICSGCHALNEDLTLRDRVWTCTCGVIHDRDLNAAINILRAGMSALGLGDVSLVERQAIPA